MKASSKRQSKKSARPHGPAHSRPSKGRATAATTATAASTRFPGESAEYRAAREHLLKQEIDLRRQIEAVAALRRQLPLGGRVREDYVFQGEGGPVRLSELFAPGRDTLIVYSYMFGPAMPSPCVMCTSIVDSLDGATPHVNQRATLVVVARSPIARVQEFARSRGWQHVRLLSSADNTYNRDYHAEKSDGSQWPIINVFVKRGPNIHHFYSSELLFAPADRGQNERHVDLIWPLWNLLDLTPEGRGTSWFPRLRYE
jgi:predicted dithiol-disulfide oxidoreductase (DUF899 family)